VEEEVEVEQGEDEDLSVLERGVVGAQEVTRKAWTNIEATSSIDVSYSRESITPDVVSCLEILDLRITDVSLVLPRTRDVPYDIIFCIFGARFPRNNSSLF
jgi:hypothetical protein